MTNHPAAVISDANVLIDYIKVERTKVLRLVSEHLFPIKLPRSILAEVDQLTQDQAEASRQITQAVDRVADMLGQITAAVQQQTDGYRVLAGPGLMFFILF